MWGLIVLSLWLTACQAEEARPITDANEAKAMALKHLRLVEDRTKRRVNVDREGDKWVVWVERVPETFGRTYVWISECGRIIDVELAR